MDAALWDNAALDAAALDDVVRNVLERDDTLDDWLGDARSEDVLAEFMRDTGEEAASASASGSTQAVVPAGPESEINGGGSARVDTPSRRPREESQSSAELRYVSAEELSESASLFHAAETPRPPRAGPTETAGNSTGRSSALGITPTADIAAKEQLFRYIDKNFKFGLTDHTLPVRGPLGSLTVADLPHSGIPTPFRISFDPLPEASRVETQIKLSVRISPPLTQIKLVHLALDTISRNKYYLKRPLHEHPAALQAQCVHLDAFLVDARNARSIPVCEMCIKREERRASRRKSGVSDNLVWCHNPDHRAIIFNNDQIVPLLQSRECSSFELVSRIVCYCRHHHSTDGFRVLLVLRDNEGHILAQRHSDPIMITDRQLKGRRGPKSSDSDISLSDTTTQSSITAVSRPLETAQRHSFLSATGPHVSPNFLLKEHIPSPMSMSDENTELHPSMHFNQRRKRNRFDHSVGTKSELCHTSINKQFDHLRHSWSRKSGPSNVLNFDNQRHRQFISKLPTVDKIIPTQGPISGGIEVTILGSNFEANQIVKFGPNRALSTQVWSSSTIVTYLPPASAPGTVQILVLDPTEDETNVSENRKGTFTYVDETDRQLIELALQIVGLKMNGKLEDAKQIAKKIVGNDRTDNGNNNDSIGVTKGMLTRSMLYPDQYLTDETLLLKVVSKLTSASNISMCNSLGHTLLHLASLKGDEELVNTLIKRGARVDDRDMFGMTPLHYACIRGKYEVAKSLLAAKCDFNPKSKTGSTPWSCFQANFIKVEQDWNREIVYDFFELISTYKQGNIIEVDSDVSLNVFGERGSLAFYPNSDYASRTQNEANYTYSDDSSFSLPTDYEDDDVEDDITNLISSQTSCTSLEVIQRNESRIIDETSDNSERSSVESLPKYEDLYPRHHDDNSIKSTVLTSNDNVHLESFEDNSGSSEYDEDYDEGDEMINLRFNNFFQSRQNFKNDKMLLFFWLPMSLFILTWILVSQFGNSDNQLQQFNEYLTTHLRKVLAKILLGNDRVKAGFRASIANFSSTNMISELMAER